MIQAVIFDMDGLLFDTEQKWQEMEKDFIRKKGITINTEMQKHTLGLRTLEMVRYWYNYKPWPYPDFEKSEMEIEENMRHFYISHASLMKGAIQILDLCKQHGLHMALASSSPMMLINTFLDKFDLQNIFEVTHSAEFEEYGKPHPGVYIATAKKLGLHPSLCLAFEDSFNGLLAAKSAMMLAVAVPDSNHYEDPRFAIADLKIRNLEQFGTKELGLLMGS
jgi:sugar-phosphatase